MSPSPVLVVVPSLQRGGAERHAQLVAGLLDPARWAPHVLSFGEGPLRADLARAGIPVDVVPLPGGARALPAAAAAVRRAVEQVRPVLVSGHGVVVELATRWVLRERPVPNITWKHTYGHIGYRGRRERLQERLSGGVVTRYGAVCHTQVRYLTDQLGIPADRISVVPNAVPVPARAEPLPAGAPTVLVVAAMRADKDHELVLRAFAEVLRHRPDARLRLAGDGPCRPGLERRTAELGIAGSVEFLGVRDDTTDLLREASLLALGSYAVECFPYAVLEAMAAGRGVVATDVGGLPELVDDGVTGLLVPPHDVDAFARALLDGLTDATSVRPALGPAGHERVRTTFPVERWASSIDRLFDTLAGTTTVVAPALHPEGMSP